MPSIRESQDADLSKYGPLKSASKLSPPITNLRLQSNVFLRCPLPPFNADPDSLRQFEASGQIPQLRIIPLPPAVGVAAATSSIVAKSALIKSSNASSTVPVATTLSAQNVLITTPVIAPFTEYQTSVTMAKSFQLLSMSVNVACGVRLYGTAVMQAFDASRAVDDPVPPEITGNIITCVMFDTLPYAWAWQNRMGANQDVPQSSTIYVTLLNASPDATTINVSILYLPLES